MESMALSGILQILPARIFNFRKISIDIPSTYRQQVLHLSPSFSKNGRPGIFCEQKN
jgi:hypothetical protein